MVDCCAGGRGDEMTRTLLLIAGILIKELKKQQSLVAYYKGLYEGEKLKTQHCQKHH